MSQKYPITISSWTLGDQCRFEERVAAAKNAGFEGIENSRRVHFLVFIG